MGVATIRREPPVTQYLLGVYHPEGEEPPPAGELAGIMADVDVVNAEMMGEGALVFAGGLHPSSNATVVRVQDGEVVITDGPWAQVGDPLGGFWIIESPDLDTALAWAGKASQACRLPLEVRPFQDDPG